MISIVVTEKGGTERKEIFEQDEISIGRVKGNDLLLAKGNVSKRHARLIFRDGRFVVTDLNSTNGTYVNHRRITHATLVREGDRIYVGDFVLRVEMDAKQRAESQEFQGPPSSTSSSIYQRAEAVPVAEGAREEPAAPPGPGDVVSHFPIEHDPDESSSAAPMPSPPRVPGELRADSTDSHPAAGRVLGREALGQTVAGSAPGGPEPTSTSQEFTSNSHPPVDEAELAARQQCFDALLAKLEAATPAGALDSEPVPAAAQSALSAVLERELEALARAGAIPAGLDESGLREAARRELFELGPLGGLLDDPRTTQVQVVLRELSIVRQAGRARHPGLGFSSEGAVARALRRLCARSAVPLGAQETYVERTLPGGARLSAVRPPAAPNGHVLVLQKLRRADTTLDALVRSGAISRAMATLLGHCVAGRVNLLVAGPAGDTESLADALAHAVPKGDRALWLAPADSPEERPADMACIQIGASAEESLRALRAASQMGADHLFVPPLERQALAEVIEAIARGAVGVVLQARGATLRQAVGRLAAEVAAVRPGIGPEVARHWLASSFEMGIEVSRLRDGRLRATRMAEFRPGSPLPELRDVFTFVYHRTAAGGSIEGSFHAAGAVPRLVEDLAARGMPVDTSIFRRHPSG
ncbi:MAG: Flp pilus assembly complex ATPase component TadA [Deltaproteobacteria bacterium]|nr:Flp pilus assembly complex ATPase component TadA [Deltaproteobacteria bacterium]